MAFSYDIIIMDIGIGDNISVLFGLVHFPISAINII